MLHRGDGHQGAAGHGRPGAGPRWQPPHPAAAAAGAAGRGAAADARLAGTGRATGASLPLKTSFPPEAPSTLHICGDFTRSTLAYTLVWFPSDLLQPIADFPYASLKPNVVVSQRPAQQVGQPPPAKVQRLDVPQQQQTPRPGTAGAYVPMLGTPTASVQVPGWFLLSKVTSARI